MKKLLLVSLVIVMYLEACNSGDSDVALEGRVSFAFNPVNEEGRLNENEDIAFVYFEASASQNETEIQLLPVFTYNNQFITPGILLPSAEYSLEKFVALNDEKEVIYGVPLSGTVHADFVNSPLPLTFQVTPVEQNEVSLQVLSIADSEPEDFGLSSFKIKPLCIKEIPVIVNTIREVSTGVTACILTVEAFDTAFPEEKWMKTYNLVNPASIKLPIGYDQYKMIATAEGMQPQSKYFRTDFYDGNLVEYEYLDFELIPENSPHVITLEDEGYKFYVSTDPCRLWARMEMPEDKVFELDYIKYYEVALDEDENYLGQLYPGGGLVHPPLIFVNYNNLFSDGGYFGSESYCENYLQEDYRDRLHEVILEKGLLLDFDFTGDESKLEDYDVHLIHVY